MTVPPSLRSSVRSTRRIGPNSSSSRTPRSSWTEVVESRCARSAGARPMMPRSVSTARSSAVEPSASVRLPALSSRTVLPKRSYSVVDRWPPGVAELTVRPEALR